jgi:phosphohistidine swiveling domain-containing protein
LSLENPQAATDAIDPALMEHLDTITEEMELVSGDYDTVEARVDRIDEQLHAPPTKADLVILSALARLLAQHDGTLADPLFALLEKSLAVMKRPWLLLKIMIAAEYEAVRRRALDLLLQAIDGGKVRINDEVLDTLAGVMAEEDGPADDEDFTIRLTGCLRRAMRRASKKSDPLIDRLLAAKTSGQRDLLAGLLDAEEKKLPSGIARELLGAAAHDFLKPYLDYTNAGFRDLVTALPIAVAPGVLDSFKRADAEFGPRRVREVISLVGWDRVNLGLRLERYRRIEVTGSLPIHVTPRQALVFDDAYRQDASRDITVATTLGSRVAGEKHEAGDDDPIGRFRTLNIVHAELLSEILDVAPLDRAKIERILACLDAIVADYELLFADVSREVRILPEVYGTLKARVLEEMSGRDGQPQITADVTRLVQMFEDPDSLGDVRTLHGLKRYLHQKGLRLGLKLVDTCQAPSCHVDLVLMTETRDPVVVQSIHYTEFESEIEIDADPWLSYPIRVIAEGFIRQMIHGQEHFPDVNAFVFGNEVHYYIAFRNHPAFLRVDYSPPQRGGMIDLQYLGVSNYELDLHPGKDLAAIQLFLDRLGYDVKLDGLRVLARYDKETCPNLGALCEKAEALFRLAPYLMSLDWTISSLDLTDAGRRKTAQAWAERFVASGVLPLADILSRDKLHIVSGIVSGPSGLTVTTWDGTSEYQDLFSEPYPDELISGLMARLEELEIPVLETEASGNKGLLELERTFMSAIADGLDCGRLVMKDDGIVQEDPERMKIVHPAEQFARLLSAGGRPAEQAMALAPPIAVLGRFTQFTPVGFIGGLEIRTTSLEVRGGSITIFALYDPQDVARMGLYSARSEIIATRSGKGARWRVETEPENRLWSLLLSANYVTSGPDPVRGDTAAALQDLRKFADRSHQTQASERHGENRFLQGQPAAPGRVMGRAVFNASKRCLDDLEGCIVITHEIRPEDANLLLHAAGIVSTGGSVLSHASLLAMQYGIPSIMVKADITGAKSGTATLDFETPIADITVRRIDTMDVGTRRITGMKTDAVQDGDLVVLNADEGHIRILGQERDALALHEGFRLLNDAGRHGHEENDLTAVLAVRAQKLRSRHILEKVLDRLSSKALGDFAVEEISLGRSFAHVAVEDRSHLLSRLLRNETLNESVRTRMLEITSTLSLRLETLCDNALSLIPESILGDEILNLRLRVIQAQAALDCARSMRQGCDLESGGNEPDDVATGRITKLSGKRLKQLRKQTVNALLKQNPDQPTAPGIRYRLRRIDWFDMVVGEAADRRDKIADVRQSLEQGDAQSIKRAKSKNILAGTDCGYALHEQIGWKAANLAELMLIEGAEVAPPWLVVTDKALRSLLKQPGAGASGTLSQDIDQVLQREDIDNNRKSALIKQLWTGVTLPPAVDRDVRAAYRRLIDGTETPDVALRSSSSDEDTETDMRAGEYETYLHIRGEDAVCAYLKLAWAGLWSERALYSRERTGDITFRPCAGIIMQVMADARVSGVIQTVNVPRDNYRELVINAALGLGEGVVSGKVASDMITVVKPLDSEQGALRINYITNDKTGQVVRNKRRGKGTRLIETLYHQRLRPALEYLELSELVQRSLHLEAAFGYPLDLEFAIEGTRIRLLQARPIGTPAGVLHETLEHHPFLKSKPGETK